MAKGKGVKKIVIAVLAIFGMVFLSNMVFADPINVGDTIYLYDREGTTGGGEFGVAKSSGGLELFRTFCLERYEYFTPGAAYIVSGISESAFLGGVGGGLTGDPLDPRTAYLYTQFRAGTLSNYDYTSNSSAHILDANSLQWAFWLFEQEIATVTDAQALAWISEAETAIANGTWSGLGNVRVINLVDALGNRKQDQLVMVPEPSTLLLLGAGLLGLGILGRKKFRIKP
jgi:hypothetical protein